MKKFKQFIENPHGKIHKQNTGWRARMAWIQDERPEINDWWNREKPKKKTRLQGHWAQHTPKHKKDTSLDRYIELTKIIQTKKRGNKSPQS